VIHPLLIGLFYERHPNLRTWIDCRIKKKSRKMRLFFLFKIDAGGRRQLCQDQESDP